MISRKANTKHGDSREEKTFSEDAVFVILGLGSNRYFNEFSPVQILGKALGILSGFLEDLSFSSVYKTRAMYLENQADFYNMVVSGYFKGDAFSLLKKLHILEEKLGRNRESEVRNGPRSIDADIEIFGNQHINERELIVPHEKLKERAFVLVPMLEVLEKLADKEEDGLSELRELVQSEKIRSQKIELFIKKEDFFWN